MVLSSYQCVRSKRSWEQTATCGDYQHTKEHAGLSALGLGSTSYSIHAGILPLLNFLIPLHPKVLQLMGSLPPAFHSYITMPFETRTLWVSILVFCTPNPKPILSSAGHTIYSKLFQMSLAVLFFIIYNKNPVLNHTLEQSCPHLRHLFSGKKLNSFNACFLIADCLGFCLVKKND